MRKSAFTLVELVVVVAVIALLIAILLPALARSREVARTVICGSNLRQVGLGLQMYVGDFRGSVPVYYGSGVGPSFTVAEETARREWYLFYKSYLTDRAVGENLEEERYIWKLGEAVPVFDCPSTGGMTWYRHNNVHYRKTFDYRWVTQYSGYGGGGWPSRRATNARELLRLDEFDPAAMMLGDSLTSATKFATSADAPEFAAYPNTFTAAWTYANSSPAPGYNNWTWGSTCVDPGGSDVSTLTPMGIHHQRGANLLTADGSVNRYSVLQYLPLFESGLSARAMLELAPGRRVLR